MSRPSATQWFSQWHVYRSIVDANWMAHREIFAAVRAWVLLRHPGPFTLLDLGCGDAGFIKDTFDETRLWAYTGIDASLAALAKARAQTFDVILASYAVHHLPASEKQEFFRLARNNLAPRGHDAKRLDGHDAVESECSCLVKMMDAESIRKRRILVFLLQQRSHADSHTRPPWRR